MPPIPIGLQCVQQAQLAVTAARKNVNEATIQHRAAQKALKRHASEFPMVHKRLPLELQLIVAKAARDALQRNLRVAPRRRDVATERGMARAAASDAHAALCSARRAEYAANKRLVAEKHKWGY